MNRTQKVANYYYARTELPTLRALFRPPWLFILIPYFFLFWHSFFKYLSSGNDWNYLLLTVFAEIVFLASFAKARQDGEQECVERFNRTKTSAVSNYRALKALLLKRITRNLSNKQVSSAIDLYIEKSARWKNLHSLARTDPLRIIYDPDSKPRVFALVIAVGAAIVALGVRGGATLDNVFDLYSSILDPKLFYLLIMISVAFILVTVSTSYAARISLRAISKPLFAFQGLRSGMRMPLRYLQQDLIENDQSLGP